GDAAQVAVEDLDRDVAAAGKRMREAIRPLDREDSPMQFLETKIVSGSPFEAIEIGVIQRQATTRVLVDQRERRAADVLGSGAEPFRQSSNERRLPCSQIPR